MPAIIDSEQAVKYAHGIAHGHAWRKHSQELHGINQADFEQMIYETIMDPSERVELQRDRFACWSD